MKKPAILSAMRRAIRNLSICLIFPAGLVAFTGAAAAGKADADSSTADLHALAQRSEQLKQQAVEFNRDLLLLEDSTIPGERRVTVFLSQANGLDMTPNSVEIQIDPDVNISKRYSSEEGEALNKGGSNRLYLGALPPGRHILSASLSARDAAGAAHRYSSKLSFRAGSGPKVLELELSGVDAASLELAIHESN